MASRNVALSTSDNPYNPFTEYDKWYRHDNIDHSYGTEAYLDRVCNTTRELGDEMYYADIENAVDEAVKLDLISWLYKDVHYVKVVAE